MMLKIPGVLDAGQIRHCRTALERSTWTDGRTTAGRMAFNVKNNLQVPPGDKAGVEVGNFILNILGQNQTFIGACLPLKVMPPMFNRYEGGGDYGDHIDNAIRGIPGSAHKVRTDVSATLFLSDPSDYDGGELLIEDTYGIHGVKLPAGHMVIYPGTSLHRVSPVTRGVRISAFFWVQSLVRDDGQRTLLVKLDDAIRQLSPRLEGDPAIVQLAGVYHNLLRQWSDT